MPTDKNVQTLHVALIGTMGCGKSSYVNSLLSVHKGRIAQLASEGSSSYTMTTKFKQYMCGPVLVSDTMGIDDETRGLAVEDAVSLVKGHILPDYRFDRNNPITEKSPYYRANPKNEDKVHCVIICANVLSLDNFPVSVLRKMKDLQRELTEIGVPSILLLTKIDTICKNNLSDIFHSEEVKDAVRKASDIFNISEKFIYPVKSFTNEMSPEAPASILLLFALKKALEFAQDYVETFMSECKHA